MTLIKLTDKIAVTLRADSLMNVNSELEQDSWHGVHGRYLGTSILNTQYSVLSAQCSVLSGPAFGHVQQQSLP